MNAVLAVASSGNLIGWGIVAGGITAVGGGIVLVFLAWLWNECTDSHGSKTIQFIAFLCIGMFAGIGGVFAVLALGIYIAYSVANDINSPTDQRNTFGVCYVATLLFFAVGWGFAVAAASRRTTEKPPVRPTPEPLTFAEEENAKRRRMFGDGTPPDALEITTRIPDWPMISDRRGLTEKIPPAETVEI